MPILGARSALIAFNNNENSPSAPPPPPGHDANVNKAQK